MDWIVTGTVATGLVPGLKDYRIPFPVWFGIKSDYSESDRETHFFEKTAVLFILLSRFFLGKNKVFLIQIFCSYGDQKN